MTNNSVYYNVPFADFVRYENINLELMSRDLACFRPFFNTIAINPTGLNQENLDVIYANAHEIVHAIHYKINKNAFDLYYSTVDCCLIEYVTDWLTWQLYKKYQVKEFPLFIFNKYIKAQVNVPQLTDNLIDDLLDSRENDYLKGHRDFSTLSALVQRLKFKPREMEFTC